LTPQSTDPCFAERSRPYSDVIRRYNALGTLFYRDPPYWGNEGDYGAVFTRDDFTAFAA
jgi:DNA adenine methylase